MGGLFSGVPGVTRMRGSQHNSLLGGIQTANVSNSFNRITILLAGAIAVIVGCSLPGVKGNGTMKTENRPISDFSALEVSGAYQIKWSSGKSALTIFTDQNLLPLITTSVTGNNTLRIDSKENLRPTKGITINLSSASLTDVKLNGAVSLTAR